MDRRFNADFYLFVSPVVELREFLEEAYAAKQKLNDLFLLSPGTSDGMQSLSPNQDYDIKSAFVKITNCAPATARKIFDDELQYALERNTIAKNAQRKSNYLRDLKYDKFDCSEKKLKRGHSTPLEQPCEKDIVLTCTVVVPHNKILSQEETRNTRLLAPQRKLMLRGDSTLLSLRQKIVRAFTLITDIRVYYSFSLSFQFCICDAVARLEDGHELEPLDSLKTDMAVYPSSFIFIHDTFYIDYSLPNSQDISEPIREFMARKKCFDPVTSRDIEGVKIIDLKLRLGQPYVFQHSGTCEHLLVFHDLRLLEKTDVQALERYPLVLFEKRGDVRCAACKQHYAAFVVEECDRLPSPYMMFCDECFREFFFMHGHKIGQFKAHPYHPINRFTVLGE
uniref:snRNA-activating protein complex subunit 3 n=1 Tax=Angiostrongylus cantonensis TaxID=6313 RepID=A0A158PAK1_ANGCA